MCSPFAADLSILHSHCLQLKSCALISVSLACAILLRRPLGTHVGLHHHHVNHRHHSWTNWIFNLDELIIIIVFTITLTITPPSSSSASITIHQHRHHRVHHHVRCRHRHHVKQCHHHHRVTFALILQRRPVGTHVGEQQRRACRQLRARRSPRIHRY